MDKLIRRIYFFAFISAFQALFGAAYALEISGYDAGLYDRFISGTYGTDSPVANPDFIGAAYDWSGVGWQTDYVGRSVALVSPLNFVCANHYRVPVGSTVSFLNTSGQLKNYTVQGYSTFDYQATQNGNPVFDNSGNPYMIIPDLALGWFTEAVSSSDGIANYSVIDANDTSTYWFDTGWYTGRDILAYGWTARAGNNTIDAFENVATTGFANPSNGTLTAVYSYNRATDPQGQAGAVGGDSGSPSFLVWNGQLTVAGTHFAVSSGTSAWNTYDSFVAAYADDIDSVMSSSGYSLNRIKIDVFPDKIKNAGFEQWDMNQWKPVDWVNGGSSSDWLFDTYGNDNAHKRSGAQSVALGEQTIGAGEHHNDTYLHQTVAGSQAGQAYAFSFWYQNLINVPSELLAMSAEVIVAAGIDPTGGNDPDSPNVIWNMVTLTPGQFDNAWHQLAIAAQSAGSPMTFFIRRLFSGNVSAEDIAAGKYWSASMFIDDAAVSIVPEPATLLLMASGMIGAFALKKKR